MGNRFAGIYFQPPQIWLKQPASDEVVALRKPIFIVEYAGFLTGSVSFELDKTTLFSSPQKQTGIVNNVEDGGMAIWSPATDLLDGDWYWRANGSNEAGESGWTEARKLNVQVGVFRRAMYFANNVAKYGPDLENRALYYFDNVAKYGPDWTNVRAYYHYDNVTDDPPFPWIQRLSVTRSKPGGMVTIYGNGFGSKKESDPTNADRAARGYGGEVWLGARQCTIMSWSWTEITFQVPIDATSGAVKVRLTTPEPPGVRDSNLIVLEITVVEPTVGTGLEFYVCPRNDPNKRVALLDGARDKAFQMIFNEAGSGKFSINRNDLKGGDRDLIADGNFISCVIDGIEYFKWIIESRRPVYVTEGDFSEEWIEVSGRGILSILETAVVYPETLVNPKSLERKWEDTPAAQVLKILIDEAKARGAIPAIEYDFTATTDSYGIPWDDASDLSFHVGMSLAEVVNKIVNGLGIFDIELKPSMMLRAYKDGKGSDVSSEVRYFPGQGLIKHENVSDLLKLRNVVIVEGEEGGIAEAQNSDSITEWGRREGYLMARSVPKNVSKLYSYGFASLRNSSVPMWGIQVEVDWEPFRPFEDFGLGDWIWITIPPKGSDLLGWDGKVRVKGMTITEDNDTGHLTVQLDLNNMIIERELRMAQVVERLAMNSTTSSSLSENPAQATPVPATHTHEHGSLTELGDDDHPQYLNVERHTADPHSGIVRVTSIKKSGEEDLTGNVTLKAGDNVSLAQNNETKEITIAATGGGGGGGIEVVTELPSSPSNGQTVFLYNQNYQYLATYYEPTALWYRTMLAGTNYPWLNIYKPETLYNLFFGDAYKSIVSVTISTDFTTALRIKGAANSTRQLTWTFTSGAGKFAIWVGCETEGASYDYAYVYLDDVDISEKMGGTILSKYIERTLTAGSHTLKITYRKDSSVDGGYDGVQVYAVAIP